MTRLDQYMAQYWPEYSRSSWQKKIENGQVMVNGTVCTSVKHILDEDDEVTIKKRLDADVSSQTLPVLYEDEHVIVIDKPLGTLTHSKGTENDEFTVATFVLPRMSESEDTNRPGIVHRLDRDTSGVIITAKDSSTKRFLQKQFQDRRAKKTYHALIWGTPKHHEANIDLPIMRNPKKPSTFRVDPKGKSAQTHYRVLASNERYSLVELKPTTGRTHQLRVHMAHLGTPIVGDRIYATDYHKKPRLYLHASELEITLPGGNRQTFRSMMPPDFESLVS